jgi:hypothetical protein
VVLSNSRVGGIGAAGDRDTHHVPLGTTIADCELDIDVEVSLRFTPG